MLNDDDDGERGLDDVADGVERGRGWGLGTT